MVEQLTPATIKIYFYLPAASMFRGELKCSLKGILNCHKENGGSKDNLCRKWPLTSCRKWSLTSSRNIHRLDIGEWSGRRRRDVGEWSGRRRRPIIRRRRPDHSPMSSRCMLAPGMSARRGADVRCTTCRQVGCTYIGPTMDRCT